MPMDVTLANGRHLRPGGAPDVVRLRTAHSLDWPIFMLAGAVGVVVAAVWLPPAALLPGCIGLFAAWVWLQRTSIDRRRRVFGVHPAFTSGSRAAVHPLGPLSIRRVTKVSKGTTTITYVIRSGGHDLAFGLPHATAEELANELAEWLGEAPPTMPS